MTLQEIGEQIKEQFPDRSMRFGIEVWWHGRGTKQISAKCFLYDVDFDERFHGSCLTDCLNALQARINSTKSSVDTTHEMNA